MKKSFLFITLLVLCLVSHTQTITTSCKVVTAKKSTKTELKYTESDSLVITLSAPTVDALVSLLKKATLVDSAKTRSLFELSESILSSKPGTKPESLIRKNSGPGDPPDSFIFKQNFKVVRPKDVASFMLIFDCGARKDTIICKNDSIGKKGNTPPSTSGKDDSQPFQQIDFIPKWMTDAVQSGNTCSLCEKAPHPINNRGERKYATDYIVLYDPMIKDDAYTICKHIYKRPNKEEKNNGLTKKLIEKYRKVGAKWFAPHVGSQIRFEVVNLPLYEKRRITVNAEDVFNSGSSQFQGIINSQVTANIVSRLTTGSGAGTAVDSNANGEQSFQEELRAPDDAEKLAMLHEQLLDYVGIFRVSSCTIDEHFRNLPAIIKNINDAFGTTAGSISSLVGQLKNKFAGNEELKAIVDEINELLCLFRDLKPLAYTTLRAKNRDYMVVKTFDENNAEIGSENIRMSGGLKIDFSAGFVLTGLRDYSYILKDTTVKYQQDPNQPALSDTSGNMIIKENTGKRQVGVGILTHIYPRISSDYNLGITVGLMSSAELDLRFMLGGSVMLSSLFGSNNRVSFSGGVVWGKVKRLSNAYYEGYKLINNKPVFYPGTTAINTVTVPVTEHSWFFAVTMNFGGN